MEASPAPAKEQFMSRTGADPWRWVGCLGLLVAIAASWTFVAAGVWLGWWCVEQAKVAVASLCE